MRSNHRIMWNSYNLSLNFSLSVYMCVSNIANYTRLLSKTPHCDLGEPELHVHWSFMRMSIAQYLRTETKSNETTTDKPGYNDVLNKNSANPFHLEILHVPRLRFLILYQFHLNLHLRMSFVLSLSPLTASDYFPKYITQILQFNIFIRHRINKRGGGRRNMSFCLYW